MLVSILLLFASVAFAADRRMDYLQQMYGRYNVVYCPEDSNVVASLFQSLAESIPQLHNRLGIQLSDTVAFVVTPSEDEWRRVTAGAPLWANGLANPERRVAFLKSPRFGLPYGPLPQTALHEYVHLLIQVGSSGDFPRWFDEGLAQLLAGQVQYSDQQALGRAVTANRVHRLSGLELMMGMNEYEARQGYAEALFAVQLLQTRFGMSGISNLVHAVRGGAAMEDAFPRVLGMKLSSFEQEFAAKLNSTFGTSLIHDTELWISGAFILLVSLAGYAMWRKRKRTLERWQNEDRPAEHGPESGDPPYIINYEIIRTRKHDEGEEDEKAP